MERATYPVHNEEDRAVLLFAARDADVVAQPLRVTCEDGDAYCIEANLGEVRHRLEDVGEMDGLVVIPEDELVLALDEPDHVGVASAGPEVLRLEVLRAVQRAHLHERLAVTW